MVVYDVVRVTFENRMDAIHVGQSRVCDLTQDRTYAVGLDEGALCWFCTFGHVHSFEFQDLGAGVPDAVAQQRHRSHGKQNDTGVPLFIVMPPPDSAAKSPVRMYSWPGIGSNIGR